MSRTILAIPYFDDSGKQVAVRYRRSLDKSPSGKDTRFFWPKGTKAGEQVYGACKLPVFAKDGVVFVVEGESDVHAGWYHDLPVLGIPGKGMNCCALAGYITKYDIKSVYIILEPDAVGTFDIAIQSALAQSDYKGELFTMTLPTKDLCDLHVKLPDGQEFMNAWNEAVTKAVRVEIRENPLFLKLNIIREKDIRAYKRQQLISETVKSELNKMGRFIHDDEMNAYYFDNTTHLLYEINKDNEEFAVLLYKIARINQADIDWRYVLSEHWSHALAEGAESKVWKFCRYENKKLYVSRFNGLIYVLDGKTIQESGNGVDGILFLDSPDWEPWQIETKDEDFTIQKLIQMFSFENDETGLSAADYNQLFETCVLCLFLIDLLPTKPLVLLKGEKGSGKTSLARCIGRLIFGSRFDVKSLDPQKQDAFVAMVGSQFLVALDNVDSSIPWLNDRLATISTGNQISMRELYTTNTERRITPRCYVWLTARTPDFKRDDIADRTLIFKVKPIPSGKRMPERKLHKLIATYRNHFFGELLQHLNKIVAYLALNPIDDEAFDFRLADFATLGHAIWAAHHTCATGSMSGNWLKILSKMKREQESFVIEDEPLPTLIDAWLGQNKETKLYSPSELYTALFNFAMSNDHNFQCKNTHSLSAKLSSITVALETHFQIKIESSPGHGGVKMRKFKRIE